MRSRSVSGVIMGENHNADSGNSRRIVPSKSPNQSKSGTSHKPQEKRARPAANGLEVENLQPLADAFSISFQIADRLRRVSVENWTDAAEQALHSNWSSRMHVGRGILDRKLK